MSNELTLFGTEDFDEVSAQLGVAGFEKTTYFPQLKINRESETEDGKSTPVGTYCLTQDGNTLYFKPAIFRIFLNTFQYMEYSQATNTYPNKSIYIKSFMEEAHDELGGLKCGKIAAKKLPLLTKNEQEEQKAIKCYRVVFGTVEYESAVDQNGETHIHTEPLPCMWKITGVNFGAPGEALEAIKKMRHYPFQHNLILTTKRDKQGSNVFYHAIVEPDLKNTLPPLNETDNEYFKMFREFIDNENSQVLKKWEKSKTSKFVDNDLSELAADFNDACPL